MRWGFARWIGCALIATAWSCDPLAFTESSQHAAIGDGGATIDDAIVSIDDVMEGPADAPIEGPADAPPPTPDAMIDAMIDAPPPVPDAMMVDAMVDAMIDAPPTPPDAGIDGMTPADGGPGDGSITDAMPPDGRQPGLPPGGSHDDEMKSFYACSTGEGASALPLLLAILALRRRRR